MDWETWQKLTKAEREAQMSRAELDSRFDEPYRTGERIEVTFQYGETREVKRGYVGMTTGWRPVYILLHNSRSTGSSEILNSTVVAIRRQVCLARIAESGVTKVT